MHNIYVALFRFRSISSLVILRDIKIGDLENAKCRDGALEYSDPKIHNSPPRNINKPIEVKQ